jgi:hypothetical protein
LQAVAAGAGVDQLAVALAWMTGARQCLRDVLARTAAGVGAALGDELLQRGLISRDEALAHCTNKDDFLLRLSGVTATSDGRWDQFEGGKGA